MATTAEVQMLLPQKKMRGYLRQNTLGLNVKSTAARLNSDANKAAQFLDPLQLILP